tara:strand:+ start:114 stop:269 length:156 start_codon:yes stop_codon:yes gene_type:complete
MQNQLTDMIKQMQLGEVISSLCPPGKERTGNEVLILIGRSEKWFNGKRVIG